jgi:hypothetical protein
MVNECLLEIWQQIDNGIAECAGVGCTPGMPDTPIRPYREPYTIEPEWVSEILKPALLPWEIETIALPPSAPTGQVAAPGYADADTDWASRNRRRTRHTQATAG